MFIILDHDETYTADPEAWDLFIALLQHRGHSIICCTYRLPGHGNQDVEENMGKHGIPIVYAAAYKNKWEAVKVAGYNPENAIWIDDAPHMIVVESISILPCD